MLLAELEVRHSRAVAPTRRVALGPHWLPTEPAPGYGGILLAGIVAAFLPDLEPELRDEFLALADELEEGRRISQPRLRHRFQTDVVGLERTRHALVGDPQDIRFELHPNGRPVPQLLAAVYAAGRLHAEARPPVFTAIRKAVTWDGDLGPALVAYLSDPNVESPRSWRMFPTDERWALQVMGFGPDLRPDRGEIQSRFRSLIRQVHPDHGAESEGAGRRILELTEARRILLT
ncbi:MAG: J domain-containing protein [Actinomycetota bacterium]|nr:J domain-containing protein [Actinomycetota bacterium]